MVASEIDRLAIIERQLVNGIKTCAKAKCEIAVIIKIKSNLELRRSMALSLETQVETVKARFKS